MSQRSFCKIASASNYFVNASGEWEEPVQNVKNGLLAGEKRQPATRKRHNHHESQFSQLRKPGKAPQK